ncbi:MAG TPA: aminopeptidase P family protein [Bacteroidales bacterium]|nr:aminopeptidase P family protein [Bacteroidales bacterium]HPS16807.1 aminopeptidase P family protein [Bacteroidales bacterium]
MFDSKIYIKRRKLLKNEFSSGILLFLGNTELPMNYPQNTFHFRQDSTFLYFFGMDEPGLGAIIDIDNNKEIIFGNDVDIEDVIWTGPLPMLKDKIEKVGVTECAPFSKFSEYVEEAKNANRKIHFLPPYHPNNQILLNTILGIPFGKLKEEASLEFIHAVVKLRSVKGKEEIKEIESGMKTAYKMFTKAMKMAKPGMFEYEVAGIMEGIARSKNGSLSFPTILSVRGEILHGHYHNNQMKDGDLLLIDAGFETVNGYATDHTRVVPVNGKFSEKQKEIYQIVLDSQLAAIDAIKPGVTYQSIHLLSCKVIAQGLKNLGLMKGDVDEAVKAGAHAFFLPHGLGHMMGLDVHDMEDIGQIYVGYDDEVRPIDQFGTAYLRMGRRLEPGFVLTVEPGIYFIPELFNLWKSENKFTEYINYNKVEEYLGFGGIRIEDDVLVTEDGHKVLGKPIPKTIDEVEALMK